MSHWRWISQLALLLLHDESLAEHGGAAGLRDPSLLESALARPLNLAVYGEPDLAELAACHGFGLTQSHPFVDGNTRAAFLATGLFLAINGWRLQASQAEATLAMLDLAAGQLSEEVFAAWLRGRIVQR